VVSDRSHGEIRGRLGVVCASTNHLAWLRERKLIAAGCVVLPPRRAHGRLARPGRAAEKQGQWLRISA